MRGADVDGPRYHSLVLTARPGLTIKAALLLGFGVTLGLWLVTGYWLTQRFSDVESAAAEFNARYLRAQEVLREVDSRSRLASVLVRDALLASSSGTNASDRAGIEESHRAASQALATYVPVTNSATERDGIERLHREIEAFRLATAAVLATRDQSGAASRRVLDQRVVPQREILLRLSSRLQTVNREAFVAQTLSMAQVYREAQRHGWQQLGLALAVNLAIGVWAVAYATRLEGRLLRQRDRDMQMTEDLHRLSKKIVSAQEDERRMIARELHDEVGQTLAAIRVELAFLQRPNTDAALMTARLDEVRTITEGALHTIRDLSHLLHPAMLDDLGLIAALESLVRTFGARHHVRAELQHENMNLRLEPELETAIYRIVQEALSNVAKHADAERCTVSLKREGSFVRLAIQDDGVGFAAEPGTDVTRHGLGLIGIRERAALLGGFLRVVTAAGRGTRLFVEFPLARESRDVDHHASSDLSR